MKPTPSSAFRILDRALDSLLFIVLGGMAGIVFVNVFCRFVLKFSLSWADEMAQVLMIWLTFLGAAVAMRDRMHYAFDYLVRSLPWRLQRGVVIGGQVLCILMTLLLIYWSATVTLLITTWVMPATGLPRSWVYASCPVGSTLLLVYQIRNVIEDWQAPQPVPASTLPTGD